MALQIASAIIFKINSSNTKVYMLHSNNDPFPAVLLCHSQRPFPKGHPCFSVCINTEHYMCIYIIYIYDFFHKENDTIHIFLKIIFSFTYAKYVLHIFPNSF